MDADSSVPHLEGAAFDIGKRTSFLDEKNGVRIELKEKVVDSYRILVIPL